MIKRKRVDVCVITTVHEPFDGRIYERELTSLVESGLSVCLVSPWKKPKETWVKHEWVCLKARKNRFERIITSFGAFMAALMQPAKSYQFHDIDFILWAVLLRMIKKVPVVYDCHENYPEDMFGRQWIPLWLRGVISKITRLVENLAVKSLGICIVVVPSLEERFSSIGAQTVLVRNFTKWSVCRDLPHEKGLVCTGTLCVTSGAMILLEIAKELKRRGISIGIAITDRFVSGEIRNVFVEEVEKHRLNISVFQKVRPMEIDTILSKASIGLSVEQDYRYMGLGYHGKLFEYMAMGLPVIASDIPGNRKLVNEAKCGVVVPADQAKEYVNAVEKLLGDSSEFERYRENGFRAIEGIYNWDLERTKLVDLFKKITMQDKNRIWKA